MVKQCARISRIRSVNNYHAFAYWRQHIAGHQLRTWRAWRWLNQWGANASTALPRSGCRTRTVEKRPLYNSGSIWLTTPGASEVDLAPWGLYDQRRSRPGGCFEKCETVAPLDTPHHTRALNFLWPLRQIIKDDLSSQTIKNVFVLLSQFSSALSVSYDRGGNLGMFKNERVLPDYDLITLNRYNFNQNKLSPSFFEYSPTRTGWIRQWSSPMNSAF